MFSTELINIVLRPKINTVLRATVMSDRVLISNIKKQVCTYLCINCEVLSVLKCWTMISQISKWSGTPDKTTKCFRKNQTYSLIAVYFILFTFPFSVPHSYLCILVKEVFLESRSTFIYDSFFLPATCLLGFFGIVSRKV